MTSGDSHTTIATRALLELRQDAYVRRKFGDAIFALACIVEASAKREAGERSQARATDTTGVLEILGQPAIDGELVDPPRVERAQGPGGEMLAVRVGRYTLRQREGFMAAWRDGEPWRDLAGDKLVLALMHAMEYQAAQSRRMETEEPIGPEVDRAVDGIRPHSIVLSRRRWEQLRQDKDRHHRCGAEPPSYRGIRVRIEEQTP